MGVGQRGWGEGEHPGPPAVGIHLLLDFYDVPAERLTDADSLAKGLMDAACVAGMTPLSAPVLHRFPGGGLTGFLPLAESHIAFHTYPEYGYLAADVFTCGKDPDGPDKAVAVLKEALSPGQMTIRRCVRGGEIAGSCREGAE